MKPSKNQSISIHQARNQLIESVEQATAQVNAAIATLVAAGCSTEEFQMLGRLHAGVAGIRTEAEAYRQTQPAGFELTAEPEPATKTSKPKIEPHQLARIYNDHRGRMIECKAWSPARERKAAAIWSAVKQQTPVGKEPAEHWADIVRRAAQSTFLTGTNDRNWRADIDWFLRSDSWARVLEGKFDDHGAGAGTQQLKPMGLDDLKAVYQN